LRPWSDGLIADQAGMVFLETRANRAMTLADIKRAQTAVAAR
jgi:cystathionine beta-lyase/cystathionine gamma-synthase